MCRKLKCVTPHWCGGSHFVRLHARDQLFADPTPPQLQYCFRSDKGTRGISLLLWFSDKMKSRVESYLRRILMRTLRWWSNKKARVEQEGIKESGNWEFRRGRRQLSAAGKVEKSPHHRSFTFFFLDPTFGPSTTNTMFSGIDATSRKSETRSRMVEVWC